MHISAVTYIPTQIHDVQISKSAKPDFCNEKIHKTRLQFMYGGTFNGPKKLSEKRVTVMNKNLEIYGACQHKTTFRR